MTTSLKSRKFFRDTSPSSLSRSRSSDSISSASPRITRPTCASVSVRTFSASASISARRAISSSSAMRRVSCFSIWRSSGSGIEVCPSNSVSLVICRSISASSLRNFGNSVSRFLDSHCAFAAAVKAATNFPSLRFAANCDNTAVSTTDALTRLPLPTR